MNKTRLKQLDILYKVSHMAASHSENISNFLEDVLKIMREDMEVSMGAFTMRNADSDEFAISA